ncbi:hypothetical protein AMJ87_00490 [candidate division WOR_3 bacterium SM23_60]|uniref:Uncharacterized protein n=1 Tax=candidate division WOR_3 bacterium SM23_60 TaxID=1703780 RepID=A0A0S8GN03_UNCW3|nr:MAG: hypothetical protein AMJ87_00490 [candidate division WOR_3 bacterium SM23_60]
MPDQRSIDDAKRASICAALTPDTDHCRTDHESCLFIFGDRFNRTRCKTQRLLAMLTRQWKIRNASDIPVSNARLAFERSSASSFARPTSATQIKV